MIRTPPPFPHFNVSSTTSTAPAGLLQLQLLLPDFYNFNCSCQPSSTSTAPARLLQLQLLLPAVFNFNSSCQTSTTSPAPTSVPWAPTRYSTEPPGPTWYSTVHTYFLRPGSSPISKSDPNVTPQNATNKTSLPKMPRTKRHSPNCPEQNATPQIGPDKTSLRKMPRTKRHSPKCPGQNVTFQFAPDKTSLPNSPRTKRHSPIRPTDKISLPNLSRK